MNEEKQKQDIVSTENDCENCTNNFILGEEIFMDENSLILSDVDGIEVYGTDEQRKEMFSDWAKYMGEITNPDNSATNPFFKSKYSPLDEVLNNAKPVLSKYGFGIMQSPTHSENNVSVKTILTHRSGGVINFPQLTIPIVKDDAQGVIAGITYARRGSLNPIIATHGENDDDGNSASGLDGKKTPPKKQTTEIDKKVEEIKSEVARLTEAGVEKADIGTVINDNCIVDGKNTKNYLKIKTLSEEDGISVANNIIKALKGYIVKQEEK